jgi:hypothetical protein
VFPSSAPASGHPPAPGERAAGSDSELLHAAATAPHPSSIASRSVLFKRQIGDASFTRSLGRVAHRVVARRAHGRNLGLASAAPRRFRKKEMFPSRCRRRDTSGPRRSASPARPAPRVGGTIGVAPFAARVANAPPTEAPDLRTAYLSAHFGSPGAAPTREAKPWIERCNLSRPPRREPGGRLTRRNVGESVSAQPLTR